MVSLFYLGKTRLVILYRSLSPHVQLDGVCSDLPPKTTHSGEPKKREGPILAAGAEGEMDGAGMEGRGNAVTDGREGRQGVVDQPPVSQEGLIKGPDATERTQDHSSEHTHLEGSLASDTRSRRAEGKHGGQVRREGASQEPSQEKDREENQDTGRLVGDQDTHGQVRDSGEEWDTKGGVPGTLQQRVGEQDDGKELHQGTGEQDDEEEVNQDTGEQDDEEEGQQDTGIQDEGHQDRGEQDNREDGDQDTGEQDSSQKRHQDMGKQDGSHRDDSQDGHQDSRQGGFRDTGYQDRGQEGRQDIELDEQSKSRSTGDEGTSGGQCIAEEPGNCDNPDPFPDEEEEPNYGGCGDSRDR